MSRVNTVVKFVLIALPRVLIGLRIGFYSYLVHQRSLAITVWIRSLINLFEHEKVLLSEIDPDLKIYHKEGSKLRLHEYYSFVSSLFSLGINICNCHLVKQVN